MRVLLFMVGLVTLSYGEHGYDGSQCICDVDHPQKMLCEADFAFVGRVLSSEDKKEVFVYNVGIQDGQVFKGLSLIGVGTENLDVYTPYGTSLCGRPNLLYKEDYLFTGGFFEGKFVITYCNWVVDWEKVTAEQKIYLQTKEYLNHCSSCKKKIYGVKGALDTNQNDNDLVYPEQISGLWTPYNCYYNPVSSLTYGDRDCETSYSFCHPSHDRCDWKMSPSYTECFEEREAAWARQHNKGAAALTQYTSVRDCKKLKTKRMKKKCLKAVKQFLKGQMADMGPREMLVEMLDLRDMWLDDDLFDDDE